jgi:hypothetical protein
MTDIALENAVAARDDMAQKIAAAEEQIKEWRAKIQRAERFIADWEEFSGQKAPDTAEKRSGIVKRTNLPVQKPQNPKKEHVAEAACQIIRENGEPMTRDELFSALSEKGIIIHGQNPAVVLQTMLWRMKDRIIHLKGHGYWPREDAYMAADYEVGGDEPDGDVADDLDDEAKSLI